MKVMLVANLTLNGDSNLGAMPVLEDAPPEIAGMVFMKAAECRNLIVGANTYKEFHDELATLFGALDTVVLSKHGGDFEDVYVADTPEKAIEYLASKGYESACVMGGTQTYNSFLNEGLADELFFNYVPVISDGGGALGLELTESTEYELFEETTVDSGIVMMHFVKV